jgi:type III secretion protein R
MFHVKQLSIAGAAVAIASLSSPAFAQTLPGQPVSSPLGWVAILAGLALLPFFLIMVTSFVKIAVVLSLLRQAIGIQQVPPNQVITGLAIVLSAYIMAPVGIDMYTEVEPALVELENGTFESSLENYTSLGEKTFEPLKGFLIRHADEVDRALLWELAVEMRPPDQRENVQTDDLLVVIPAFVLTELKEAFTIGFLLFIPFIIVDLVIANILLSLGMHMLSPTTVSLPFKLLLFVLVDGWYLLIKGLILGYV